MMMGPSTVKPNVLFLNSGRRTLAAFDGLSLIERRDFLRRGLEILRALKQAGRLLPNQDWIDVFETTLSKLDDEAQT